MELIVVFLRFVLVAADGIIQISIFLGIWAVSNLTLFDRRTVILLQNIFDIDILLINCPRILNHVAWNTWIRRNLKLRTKVLLINCFRLLAAIFFLGLCKVMFGFGISIVCCLIIRRIFVFHHAGNLFSWRLQEFVDLRLSLVLNWIISTLSTTLTYGNGSTTRVAAWLISLHSWLRSIRSSTWSS